MELVLLLHLLWLDAGYAVIHYVCRTGHAWSDLDSTESPSCPWCRMAPSVVMDTEDRHTAPSLTQKEEQAHPCPHCQGKGGAMVPLYEVPKVGSDMPVSEWIDEAWVEKPPVRVKKYEP